MADDCSTSNEKGVGKSADKKDKEQSNLLKTESSGGPSPIKRNSAATGSGGKERRSGGYPKRGGASGGGTPGKDKRVPASTLEGPGSTGSKRSEGGQQGGNNKKKGKYAVKKRSAHREDFEIRPNDVFVNEKSNFVGQLSKCKRLFEKGHREVYLHGLGKSIPRAINIAFELKKAFHDTVDYTVNTSTVQVFDDIVDLEDPEQQPTIRARNVSSVDIKIYRSVNIP